MSTTYAPAAPAAKPLLTRAPAGDRAGAAEAIALAEACGLALLPWQQHALEVMLTEGPDGRWAASEFGILCPRQNGKTHLLAARVMAGLFIFDEPLITYTAHEFRASLELFRIVAQACTTNPHTKRRLAKDKRGGHAIRWAHGDESIELANGARFKIMARTRSSGRGFAGSTVILDEALELRDDNAVSSLVPTMSAQENPQLIYASTAGDPGSIVLAEVRKRAHAGNDPTLGWIEYAAASDADHDDRDAWRAANPGFGTLIRFEAIELERRAMAEAKFAQERLGIWAMDSINAVIPTFVWDESRDHTVTPSAGGGQLAIAAEVSSDRAYSSIVAAWPREDGRSHVRVSRYGAGDGWLSDELAALHANHGVPITIDDNGPARDIADALERAGVPVNRITRRDYVTACAAFLSGLMNHRITHHGDSPLDAAAATAGTTRVGEAWAWARRTADADVSPLTAATLAVWAIEHTQGPPPPLARPAVF